MDRCSNSGESGQRREGVRRERGSRRTIKACEKVEMSPNIVFFQFVAPESRKVGSLKRWVQSHLVGGEIKNCTRLWHQAHFEVIMLKTPQVRSTFGRWDVEKVHAAVARSTCRSQNVESTPFLEHFWKSVVGKCTSLWCEERFEVKMVKAPHARSISWKLRSPKSARSCSAKHIRKSKVLKTDGLRPLLDVELSKKEIDRWMDGWMDRLDR